MVFVLPFNTLGSLSIQSIASFLSFQKSTLKLPVASAISLSLKYVLQAIGGEDYTTFITFLSALEEKEKEISIKVIEDVYNAGKDVKQFMKDFAKFVLEVEKYALYKNFDYISLPNTLENELEQLIDDSLFDIMDFVVSLNNQIKWENDPKTLIELSILIYCGKEI